MDICTTIPKLYDGRTNKGTVVKVSLDTLCGYYSNCTVN